MISWSSERWIPVNVDIDRERLSQGSWAGDCFEVVAEGNMSAGVTWRDVTKEVVEWMDQVWVADHGLNI